MRTRTNGTTMLTLLALLASLSAVAPRTAHAQRADSTRRWALFGGGAAVDESPQGTLYRNKELGASGDFRLGAFPLPLRASLAFSQSEDWQGTALKFGTVSLDAVGHPLPKFLGMRPYFLGGLGVGTRGAYTSLDTRMTGPTLDTPQYFVYPHERRSWSFVEGGTGLELGRAFVQWKLQVPVAGDGYVRGPISVGFRF